jgi:broad specificity phosphatase PhoE
METKMNATIGILVSLLGQGVRRMTLLVRHAERYYDPQNLHNEPFLPLTEKGKNDAYAFGLMLPQKLHYRFVSSAQPRCVETAYQIEKGCIERGARTTVNKIAPMLSPFFLIDYEKAISDCAARGPDFFYQSWLNGHVSEDIIEQPGVAFRRLVAWLADQLVETDDPYVNIAVTHDCHIYLMRHLRLRHEPHEFTQVGYLEGVIVFELQGQFRVVDNRGIPATLL